MLCLVPRLGIHLIFCCRFAGQYTFARIWVGKFFLNSYNNIAVTYNVPYYQHCSQAIKMPSIHQNHTYYKTNTFVARCYLTIIIIKFCKSFLKIDILMTLLQVLYSTSCLIVIISVFFNQIYLRLYYYLLHVVLLRATSSGRIVSLILFTPTITF